MPAGFLAGSGQLSLGRVWTLSYLATGPSSSLAGLEVVFQILDLTTGWSRPVSGMIVP